MAETKRKKQYLAVGGVFFLLIVIPLSLMAFLVANGMIKLGDTIKERTVSVLESQDEIKMRAINTADEVANFLMECKKDLLVATIIPTTEAAYKQFIVENKKPLWVKENGKVQQVLSPLYKEISLTDKNGNELIKIVDGQAVGAGQLANVSNPANTTFKTEDYFAKAKGLNKGEVYVSPVMGNYVDKTAFEKGQRFAGILRMTTPVFSKDGFAGVISVAIDYRHLAKFTDQIVPTQAERIFETDAKTGNYAFMVDHRGFVISHPNDYHIVGLDAQGNLVPALTKENSAALTQKGQEVLNLNQLGFMDANLQEIAKNAAAGKSGVATYKFAGNTKFVAYAPIKFYSANLTQPTGFGWVGLGVDVEKFNDAAKQATQKIQKEAKAWTATVILIIIISMIILFFIMVLLIRGISRSLQAEVPAGSEGDAIHDDDDDDK
jgi:hypothetical protein